MDYKPIVGELHRFNMLHRIKAHHIMSDAGLYVGQLPILEEIQRMGTCTQKELAEVLHVSAPSIATSIKRMEKAGLVKRIPHQEDLRCNTVSITTAGKEAAKKCRCSFDALDKKAFQGLTDEECMQLKSLLCRLTEALEKEVSAEDKACLPKKPRKFYGKE